MNALILESVCTADPSHCKRMRVTAPTGAGMAGLAYVVALVSGSQPKTPCEVCGAPLGRYRVLEPEETKARNGVTTGK